MRRTGFTLVELMVVILIASVMMAIAFSGYRSMGDGNQRVSCQTNLRQIYAALRLYNADYNGFSPHYDPTNILNNTPPKKGIGLWSLYVLASNSSPDEPARLGESFPSGAAKPVGLYIRNHKQLHCPTDSDHEERFMPGTTDQFDKEYFSYQTLDAASNEWTYQPYRTTNIADANYKRQLMRYTNGSLVPRAPADSTVVTWCPWHRGSREIDNVLFYDGVVRPVPRLQPDATGTSTIEGWRRVP